MAAIANRDIKLLSKQEINPEAWNACVEKNRGLVYNLYEYLTIMAEDWSGIVIGNYEAVLPVPWKKKFTIRYIPVIPFVQQLSLLGDVNDSERAQIISCVRAFVRYGDYNLDGSITFRDAGIKQKTNFSLKLSSSYSAIKESYSENLQRNIRKALSCNLSMEACDNTEALDSYYRTYLEKIPVVQSIYFMRFRKLAGWMEAKGLSKCYCVRQGESIVAVALFFIYGNRLYNILPCTLPDGKRCGAMHFLLDQLIRQYAESNTILDFEGSDLPGVKEFYEQFHPDKETYFQYHFNDLPFPLNRLKS